jgi:hypothetical protein
MRLKDVIRFFAQNRCIVGKEIKILHICHTNMSFFIVLIASIE